MRRTRIKICGVMRPEDARGAVEAGADAIGMIFHPPSRRNIDLGRAKEIVAEVGAFVTPVGVFVDADPGFIERTARAVGLGVVQLHGRETIERVEEVGRLGLRVIKAVRVDGGLVEELARWRGAVDRLRGVLAGIVLETASRSGGPAGGAGVANDWNSIARHQAAGAFEGLPPIIAAGGLGPENVADVIRLIRPWGVDVSSGVEEGFGEKSREKMEEFVARAGRGDGHERTQRTQS